MKKNCIPDELRKNIISIYGEAGEKWLNHLPEFLAATEQEWKLILQACYEDLSFNYVAPAFLDNGNEAVLKCGPLNPEFHTEIGALQYFDGQGTVKLLHYNVSKGSMLLERITPGYSLETLSNTQEAVNISANVIQQLHRPVTAAAEFPTLNRWLQAFDRLEEGRFAKEKNLIDRARELSKDLLHSMGEQVLLHGDLHYGNILFSEQRGWLAIDPKGVIGEREYEIPLPKLSDNLNKTHLQNNLSWFIEATGFDKERILNWLFVKAVLAAVWSLEDTGKIWRPFLHCAEIVQTIKPMEI